MTQTDIVALAVTAATWTPGRCGSCCAMRAATIPVGDGRMCATCMATTAVQQLNREALEAGTASLIPAPAVWHGSQLLGLLHCEACVPIPAGFVSWHPRAGLWLDSACAEEFDHLVEKRSGR